MSRVNRPCGRIGRFRPQIARTVEYVERRLDIQASRLRCHPPDHSESVCGGRGEPDGSSSDIVFPEEI